MKELIRVPLFSTPGKISAFTILIIILIILHVNEILVWGISLVIAPFIILFGQTGISVDCKNFQNNLFRFYSVFSIRANKEIDISSYPFIQLISRRLSFRPVVAFRPETLSFEELKHQIWLLDKIGRKKLLLFSSEVKEDSQEKLREFSELLNVEYFIPKLRSRK